MNGMLLYSCHSPSFIFLFLIFQILFRVVMLNNWMGHLLRAFNTFPGDAQRLILTFLGINASTNKLSTIPAFPEDGGDIAEYANATLYNM